MRALLKFLLYTVLLAAILLIGFIAYINFTDYSPKAESLVFENNTKHKTLLSDSSTFSILSWNLGYCGLNKEMDFFYSGGKQVYPKRKVVLTNIRGVKSELKKIPTSDFMLFQEVDRASTRSYFTNQVDTLCAFFKTYNCTFGQNYKVSYVPIPLNKPMGRVNSGILTISKYIPNKSVRHSYIGNFAWPKSLFMLDRCFLVNRYSVDNGKELVLINTHNSAYDDGGLRIAQMQQIRKFVVNEYKRGNYVVVGGDWNQCAPGFKEHFDKDKMDYTSKLDIPYNLMPSDWTWFYDNRQPTNRRNKIAYKKGICLTTVIDFFLLSPNVKALSIKNISNGFNYSDHQPVRARIQLIPSN